MGAALSFCDPITGCFGHREPPKSGAPPVSSLNEPQLEPKTPRTQPRAQPLAAVTPSALESAASTIARAFAITPFVLACKESTFAVSPNSNTSPSASAVGVSPKKSNDDILLEMTSAKKHKTGEFVDGVFVLSSPDHAKMESITPKTPAPAPPAFFSPGVAYPAGSGGRAPRVKPTLCASR